MYTVGLALLCLCGASSTWFSGFSFAAFALHAVKNKSPKMRKKGRTVPGKLLPSRRSQGEILLESKLTPCISIMKNQFWSWQKSRALTLFTKWIDNLHDALTVSSGSCFPTSMTTNSWILKGPSKAMGSPMSAETSLNLKGNSLTMVCRKRVQLRPT